MSSSQSDDNENNNNASLDSSSKPSDGKLFPEDFSGSEYIRSTFKSETSDYSSEDEDFPLPRKILKKENQNQEGKQQPIKRLM